MKRYTIFNFIWDIILSSVTGGVWLVWIFIREMRGLRK